MAARYTAPARWLHWSIAVLVAIQIGLGLTTDQLDWDAARPVLAIHVQLGLILLGLMILRLLWRVSHPPPALPVTVPRWQRRLAQAAHGTLYAILLVLPLSGYALWMWIEEPVRVFGGPAIPVPDLSTTSEFWRSLAGYIHEYAFYGLALLLFLHVSGALTHELRGAFRPIRDRMT